MNYFLLNIILAVAWAALNGEMTIRNLVGGFVIGYLMLLVSRNALGEYCIKYVNKVRQVGWFVLFFIWSLIVANLRVAWEVLTPGHGMHPAIVAIPLDLKTDLEILLLANFITLTPGTLSLDVSLDKRTLYVHSMYVEDVETFRRSVKQGFEKRILELFK